MNPIIIGSNNGFKPDPRYTVSEWAGEYRILTTESSAEAGKWSNERTPYLIEIMNEMSPTSPTQQVKVIKGTQLGFSSCGDNIAMAYLDFYPCPILYILPTETLAKGTSIRRITPAIRAVPQLAKKVTSGKSKTDIGQVYTKPVAGGILQLGWSNSTASFRSFSARVVILDDVDGFGEFGEGSTMLLGKARADAFSNKKIYINSTPTVAGSSNIEVEFEDSDQREYEMPCPECNELMGFKWDYMHYDTNFSGQLKGDVKCGCPHCGSLLSEYQKTEMMSKGVWIPKNEGHLHKGYKLTSFYSPLGWLSWNNIAEEFIKADKLMKRGDASLMQTWQNTRNATVFEKQLDGVNITNANDRVEEYEAEVPDGVLIITCGVDTQDTRFELEVLGHGRNGETWSINYKTIAGDPEFIETRDDLDNYLFNTEFKRANGSVMKISGIGIDTQGHKSKAMYEYCRLRASQNVFAFKGANTINAPISNKRMHQMVYGELTLFMIGVTAIKNSFYNNLGLKDHGDNFQHFPNKNVYDKRYFDMLTAEKRNDKGGYEAIRTRNEALDCRVYAIAVLTVMDILPNTLTHPLIHVGEVHQTQQIEPTHITSNNYLDEF